MQMAMASHVECTLGNLWARGDTGGQHTARELRPLCRQGLQGPQGSRSAPASVDCGRATSPQAALSQGGTAIAGLMMALCRRGMTTALWRRGWGTLQTHSGLSPAPPDVQPWPDAALLSLSSVRARLAWQPQLRGLTRTAPAPIRWLCC